MTVTPIPLRYARRLKSDFPSRKAPMHTTKYTAPSVAESASGGTNTSAPP